MAALTLAMASVTASARTDDRTRAILDRAVNRIKGFAAVEVVFELAMENKAERVREAHEGRAFMKGNMYRVEVMDVVSYFDGQTLYSYMPEVQEVNVSVPGEEEGELMNPTILFDVHDERFEQRLVEERDGHAVIELTPRTPHKQVRVVEARVNVTTNQVERVTSFGKDGNDIVITIKSLKEAGEGLDAAFFRFDEAAHPEVEVIDLR
jgi:outer membrane lipoprotein-sorting protein